MSFEIIPHKRGSGRQSGYAAHMKTGIAVSLSIAKRTPTKNDPSIIRKAISVRCSPVYAQKILRIGPDTLIQFGFGVGEHLGLVALYFGHPEGGSLPTFEKTSEGKITCVEFRTTRLPKWIPDETIGAQAVSPVFNHNENSVVFELPRNFQKNLNIRAS